MCGTRRRPLQGHADRDHGSVASRHARNDRHQKHRSYSEGAGQLCKGWVLPLPNHCYTLQGLRLLRDRLPGGRQGPRLAAAGFLVTTVTERATYQKRQDVSLRSAVGPPFDCRFPENSAGPSLRLFIGTDCQSTSRASPRRRHDAHGRTILRLVATKMRRVAVWLEG